MRGRRGVDRVARSAIGVGFLWMLCACASPSVVPPEGHPASLDAPVVEVDPMDEALDPAALAPRPVDEPESSPGSSPGSSPSSQSASQPTSQPSSAPTDGGSGPKHQHD